MLKFYFYTALTGVGVVATLINPFMGAVACILTYLANPAAMAIDEAIRYQLWTSAAFLLSYLFHRPRPLAPAGRESIVLIALWAFVAIGFLSSAWAVVSPDAALTQISEVFKTALIATLILFVVHDERDMSRLMTVCVIGVIHAAFMHVVGSRLGYMPSGDSRTVTAVPDVQGAVMVLFAPLVILIATAGHSRTQRVLSCIATPLVLNSIVSTYERAAFMGLIVQLFCIALLLPWRIVLRVWSVGAILAAPILLWYMPPEYVDRISTILRPKQEASAASRFVINQASLEMAMDYPFGVGYRNYPDVSPRYLAKEYLTEDKRSAHNTFFSVLCELGFPGFLTWVGAFGGSAMLLRRIRKRAQGKVLGRLELYAAGLEIGLYGWFVEGWTQALHEVDPAFWFVSIAVVLRRLQYQQDVCSLEEDNAADPLDDDTDGTRLQGCGSSLATDL